MIIDHIAYRVRERHKAALFFTEALNYKIVDEFTIDLEKGQQAQCLVLKPQNESVDFKMVPHMIGGMQVGMTGVPIYPEQPEIFISDGSEGSIIDNWVKSKGGVGGVHHMAYRTDSVERTMKEWKEKGFCEFLTDAPLKCNGLTQIFTTPQEATGIIIELIEKEDGVNFCAKNVQNLMKSTKDLI